MSQHNISGSEVFGPKPFVILRGVKSSGLRRRKSARVLGAFIAGAVVTLVGGAVAVAALVGPTLFG
ncbi:hypothetical protein [Brevundimonas sp. M20]|jgi:hypothetical protein|uniref:hypothetical protein n=1 Tax=Brevundimonas sp. M20 TaxID=2591463 RepID=UPI0011464679|nr:hypothetical protein [Brevundimonas sp. M20]QDH74492.1 hypothetical protein FKQ52_14315 [Brevundimonas sp. M20]